MTREELIEIAEQVYGKCDWHDSALNHLEQLAKLVAEKATAELRANIKINQSNLLKKITRGQE